MATVGGGSVPWLVWGMAGLDVARRSRHATDANRMGKGELRLGLTAGILGYQVGTA